MSAGASAPPLSPSDSLSGRLQQLGEELHCALCLDYYEDPVILPCQHSFCRGCIRGAVRPVRSATNRQEVECPLCRKKVQLTGSADACVDILPRNFHLAGIIEKFRAAEREKTRSEQEQFERQIIKQLEHSESIEQEQENRQLQQQQQQQQQQPLSDHGKTTSATPNPSLGPVPTCKMCPYPGDIHCSQCDDHFCLQCQQAHTHGESTGEFYSKEFMKNDPGPVSSGYQDGQQQPQQLRQKQQNLQLELDQQQALSEFSPSPLWLRQQSDRWEELQQQKGTRRQASEEYPPPHHDDSDVMPYGPQSWPLSQYDRQVYPQQHIQDIQLPPPTVTYPHHQTESHQQFSPTSLTSPTSKLLLCSHCTYPAVTHCQQCCSYFCWQCMGERHDPKSPQFQSHNLVELIASVSSPSSLDLDLKQLAPNLGSMPSTMPMTIPYKCDIEGMGPGKCITVRGQPNKEKCVRFHINLMCNKNLNSGDIAFHFNPRFTFPKVVVRNTRIGGKYGKEERNGPSFPFGAGRPFKIELTCLIDKYKVSVDGKPFITYAHRLKDLRSIKVFNVGGDVKITSVTGCV